MRGSILFVVIAVLFLSCDAGDNPETPASSGDNPEAPASSGISLDLRKAVPQGDSFAIAADFAGMCHTGNSPNLDREYEIMDEMGIIWVHRDFSWSEIQPAQNTWNLSYFDSYVQRANEEGKKIIAMLLYDVGWVHELTGNPTGVRRIWPEEIPYFCEYAVNTVKRYNGQPGSAGYVDAWVIWNEPDLTPRFWTNDENAKEDFYALTTATAAAIRELDEEEGTTTTLVGGVFTSTVSNDWITGLFESGAMDQVDYVALHPYGPKPESVVSVFNSFKQKVAPYGFADKIWINEVGYPTYSERGAIPSGRYGTDQYEGDMPETVTKTFTFLAAGGAPYLTWYHMFDGRAERDDSDSEHWFGLLWRKSSEEWVKKGGYWGFALCAKHLPGKTYRNLTFPGASIPDDIHSYYFEGSDGKHTLVVWSSNPLIARDITVSFNGSNHQLWDVETGASAAVNKISTHTLYPINKSQQTLLFFTWEE